MNILITQDATVSSNWREDGWATAISFFGGQELLKVIVALTLVQNDVDEGESYDEAISETIEELISVQIGKRVESGAPREIDADQKYDITNYLKQSVKALRPYMPTGGAVELVTYLTDLAREKLYMVVRYHPDDEHTGKAFTSPGVRG